MHSNIVKIRIPSKNKYGTGLVLSDKIVITSEHVSIRNENICIEYEGKKFIGKEKIRDDYVALIEVNNDAFAKKYTETDDKLYFTEQEIISSQSELKIEGYYSSDLKEHFIGCIGAAPYSSKDYHVDSVITKVVSGKLSSYKGMSGSPIVCNNRVIGLLQVQSGDPDGELGLLFTSVKLFKKALEREFLKESEYISYLLQNSYNFQLIEENKRNLKYIPEIFIEDDKYKDILRFFSDPSLFFSRGVYDLQNIFASHLSEIYIHLNTVITKINNSNILNTPIATLSTEFLTASLSKPLAESYKEFCLSIRNIITELQSLFGKRFFENNDDNCLGYSLIVFIEHLKNAEKFLSNYPKLFDLSCNLHEYSDSINDYEEFYIDLEKLINELILKDENCADIGDIIICFNLFNQELLSILEYIKFIKKRVVLLTKGAGQGKTNFLCDFTENFLMRRKIPCVYLNASTFAELPSNKIMKILTDNEKWSPNYVRDALDKLWITDKRFVVVLIDGLNENSCNNFATMIEESINELLKIPKLKLVMTTRSELFKERFPRLSEQILGENFSYVNMKSSYSETFKNRLVEGYFKHFNISVVNNSLYENVFDVLSDDTLLLRIFCEVYQGKSQVYMQDMFVYSLFDKYYSKKKDEIKKIKINGDILFDKVIGRISSYMISNEIFNNVPEEYFNNDEIKLLEYLLTSDVVLTTDLFVTKGLLDNIPQKCVSFTFDAFRDYCLTQYMVTTYSEDDFRILWKKMHDKTWSILEGVEKYVFYLAKKVHNRILPLLQMENNYNFLYWNNIWFIDEKNITDEDITKFKCQIFDNDQNIAKVCSFLLRRTDINYYKSTSINLLFDTLNELSCSPGKYDTIIRTLFPRKKNNNPREGYKNSKVVFYCDLFIAQIQARFREHSVISHYALRLTVYFFHIMPKEIGNLWLDISLTTPSIIENVVDNFQRIDNSYFFVRQNLSNILNLLMDSSQNITFSKYKNILCDNSDYREVFDEINEIWEKY